MQEYESLKLWNPTAAEVFCRVISGENARVAWSKINLCVARKLGWEVGEECAQFAYAGIKDDLEEYTWTNKVPSDDGELARWVAGHIRAADHIGKIAMILGRYAGYKSGVVGGYVELREEARRADQLRIKADAFVDSFHGLFGECGSDGFGSHVIYRALCKSAHYDSNELGLGADDFNPITEKIKKLLDEVDDIISRKKKAAGIQNIKGKPAERLLSSILSDCFYCEFGAYMDETVALFVSTVSGAEYSEQAVIKARTNPKSEK